MSDPERHNRVNLHHHLREDIVVLLPYVGYRNGTLGFGDGCILRRTDTTSMGDTVIRMLEHCAAADTSPLEERRNVALERARRGFDLSFDEHFPSFGIPDNWGRIYEQFPALLYHPRASARVFADAEISDRNDPDLLTMSYLQLRRQDRGIYSTAHSETINRSAGPTTIGELISDRLQRWRPKPRLLGWLFA
ncbi:hypothetical protein [Novipirellula artificiosorum]|uniref:Uncharacterized protein n=1 Tax=Novipirellula artificiosorum TaxID=2528016 RepID=A0A5C6DM76_9BACT|nr:hypothetical protein [Novipirellula artificiosorum]TWU35959.1 hypothetical protein Poly41_37110 [Novipirellula artificiosorum]